MQKRWTQLTQFLHVPGAPIDNNESERILKTAILHRKNSLFYRSERGAQVGDLFMSFVQTCRSNAVNPFDYIDGRGRQRGRCTLRRRKLDALELSLSPPAPLHTARLTPHRPGRD